MSTTAEPRTPSFGLAHVDLMDLHLARTPDGFARHEVLPEDKIDERYRRAQEAGAGFNRWSLYWDLVEATSGREWDVPDAIVARDLAAGLAPLVILQGTPPHLATGGSAAAEYPRVGGGFGTEIAALADAPVAPQSSPPQGLTAPAFLAADGGGTDDPNRAERVNPVNPWAAWVDAAVERYRPGGELARQRGWGPDIGVRHWEVGNEPNLAHFWSGTPSQYARFLTVAHLVIKWRDPGATVVHGGIADAAGADVWYRSFLAALRAAGAGQPFDAAGWHWYTYPSLMATGPVKARTLLREAGLSVVPIWVTEFGVPIWNEYPGPCWDPTSPWRATTAEQAGYVWLAVAEGRAADVDTFIYFQLYDDCGNGPTSYDAFGLVRNQAGNVCWTPPEGRACWSADPSSQGRPRPAYDAFQTAADVFADAEPLWRPGPADGWERILFYQPPDRRLTVAWSRVRADLDVSLAATGSEAQILSLDSEGQPQRRNAEPDAGQIRVQLPGATNRNNPGNGSAVMGGRPVLIVERDTFPPFRAELVGPSTADRTAVMTVKAADGGTGVGAYRLLTHTERPEEPGDWQPGPERPWTADALGAEIQVELAGSPGQVLFAAVQVRDRAGNWTAVPASAQVRVVFEGDGPGPEPRMARIHLPAAYARAELPGRPGLPPSPTVPLDPTAVASATDPNPASATPVATRGSPSVTPSEPSVTETSTARPGDRTATPGASTPIPSPDVTPDCVPVAVEVQGPRGGRPNRADEGTWTLRGLTPAGDLVVSTQPVGEPACASPGATDLTAFAHVPGYVTWPPQRLDASPRIRLAAAPSAVTNGGFEAGLAGWSGFGAAGVSHIGDGLAGAGAARLGGAPGDAYLVQALDVPVDATTLSVAYALTGCPGDCGGVAQIDIRRLDRSEAGTVLESGTALDSGGGWSHLWYDVSGWAGVRAAITFRVTGEGNRPAPTWILDNVAVGTE